MKRSKSVLAKQMKEHSIEKEVPETINKNELLSMGSTLLNLAMSDHIEGGALAGHMVNIIGSSHGGKTMLALTCFAEAAASPLYKSHALIYDDSEHANSFNVTKLFGVKTANRLKPPRGGISDTVETFHSNLLYAIEEGTPFIYVQDSFDSLDSLDDQKSTQEMVTSIRNNASIKGSYGMAKAKRSSSILRSCTASIASSKSFLFMISQTRDNVDLFSPQKDARSGGRALKFYAHHEMWMKPVKTLKKRDEVIGHTVQVKITKNKITGKERTVSFDIYYDYGIDDIGSCIDYLLSQGRWSGGGSKIIDHKNDFPFPNCTKQKLITAIEQNEDHIKTLKEITGAEWKDYEDSLKLGRRPKYN